jgi:hypothetical protein
MIGPHWGVAKKHCQLKSSDDISALRHMVRMYDSVKSRQTPCSVSQSRSQSVHQVVSRISSGP